MKSSIKPVRKELRESNNACHKNILRYLNLFSTKLMYIIADIAYVYSGFVNDL
jgi:hypothetical protein